MIGCARQKSCTASLIPSKHTDPFVGGSVLSNKSGGYPCDLDHISSPVRIGESWRDSEDVVCSVIANKACTLDQRAPKTNSQSTCVGKDTGVNEVDICAGSCCILSQVARRSHQPASSDLIHPIG